MSFAATAFAPDALARTLAVDVARLESPQASAQALRIVVIEQADGASLRLEAARLSVSMLALDGRLAWDCKLQRDDDGSRSCAGTVHLQSEGGVEQSAELAARVSGESLGLRLGHVGSRVSLTLPFAAAAPIVLDAHRVPADWIKAPLAQAWPGGELRNGTFDAQGTLAADGRVDATWRADGLGVNTRDGSVAGEQLNVSGKVDWIPAPQAHVIVDASFAGGIVQAGTLRVRLPDTQVEANLDARAGPGGRWDVARFAWRDGDALAFEADGQLEPSALAPLRRLHLRIDHAQFPQAAQRYAKELLVAQGLGALSIKGDLAGEIDIDDNGPQRIALQTKRLDLDDGAGNSARGLSGGIDWAAHGVQPPQALAWKSARIDELSLPAVSSRWQSRDGALHLLGSVRAKMFGGDIVLERSVVRPQATQGERLDTAFSIKGVGYDSADGTLAAAQLHADGRLRVSGAAGALRAQIEARFRGGEALAGPVYVKLPATPIEAKLDLRRAGTSWHVDAFDWCDPGTLDLHARGEFAPANAQPLKTLEIEVREAQLAAALERYGQSWLASKGYPKLEASGLVSGALQFDAAGMQRFRLTARDASLRDGGGRFALAGLEGGVDWDFNKERPATTLGWRSLEWFRIPLGATSAKLESRQHAIVLAEPLSVDVLGGQLRLEKLSLLPRSPRGERYTGSFAIVGIQMAQLSAALGWPHFGGNLSGGIPEIELSGDTIELRGGLDLYVFDGHVGVSGVTLERPFGVAPSLGADIHFENLDLDQVTSAFSFGGMSGRLMGTIAGLRLVDWSPVAFDAWLRTSGGGRMSYKAVDDITAIGGGGGLSANLQTMALKIFDTFGYRRLGLRCRLRDEVCLMGGVDPLPTTAAVGDGDGYTIVEGSSLPRIMIVGHRRRVDWPTLVRRLQEATQGQGPVIE